MRTKYDELKKKHPKAVLAVLRNGEKGYDPAAQDKAYTGWKDAYFNSHGPDGMFIARRRTGVNGHARDLHAPSQPADASRSDEHSGG